GGAGARGNSRRGFGGVLIEPDIGEDAPVGSEDVLAVFGGGERIGLNGEAGGLGIKDGLSAGDAGAESPGGGGRAADEGSDAGDGDGEVGSAEWVVGGGAGGVVIQVAGGVRLGWARGVGGRGIGAPASGLIVDIEGVGADDVDVLAVR